MVESFCINMIANAYKAYTASVVLNNISSTTFADVCYESGAERSEARNLVGKIYISRGCVYIG